MFLKVLGWEYSICMYVVDLAGLLHTIQKVINWNDLLSSQCVVSAYLANYRSIAKQEESLS